MSIYNILFILIFYNNIIQYKKARVDIYQIFECLLNLIIYIYIELFTNIINH